MRAAPDNPGMNAAHQLPIAILLLALASPAQALELFGVTLESSNRDQLREAAKEAGMTLIREGGDDIWFDIYDSSTVLTGSVHFYLGFIKRDQRFAFAEYEFRGFNSKSMLQRLSARYGAPEVRRGKFLSDRSYRWQRDGIEIRLASDWQLYRTRLSYVIPANMVDLQAERAAYFADQEPRVSLY